MSQKRRIAIIPSVPGKTRITIRLDNEILNWFRDQVEAGRGGSYQAMINAALHEHIRLGGTDLETVLRAVIREELGRLKPPSSFDSIPSGRL